MENIGLHRALLEILAPELFPSRGSPEMIKLNEETHAQQMRILVT